MKFRMNLPVVTIVDGQINAEKYHDPVKICLERSNRWPIRFRTKSMCIDHMANGSTIEQFICRTSVDRFKEGVGNSVN